MSENDLSKIVVDLCLKIHRRLGPGLLESVYEEALCYELGKAGLAYSRQQQIEVLYDEVKMDIGFRADIIVEKKLLLELKSIEDILPVHLKILLTYLRVTNIKLGLLINFNEALIKDGIKRMVNNPLKTTLRRLCVSATLRAKKNDGL
jgi:GxxExxY protein